MNYAYESFPVSDEQKLAVEHVRQAFSELEMTLVGISVSSNPRYVAIFRTKLEEACMFAVKSITHPDIK